MGTRADFYVGRGVTAEWLGSIGHDGYPDGIFAKPYPVEWTEQEWRAWVKEMLAGREDGTQPEQGWPWPWKDSRTTDYAYAFDGETVWASCFGHSWVLLKDADSDSDSPKDAVFPDMTARKAVTLGPRSGLLVFKL